MRVAWATQQDPEPPVSKETETDRQQRKTTSLRKKQGKVLETSRPCHMNTKERNGTERAGRPSAGGYNAGSSLFA